MAKFKDYYKVLGIEKGASESDIRKAYKKLAKAWHPDVNKAAGAEGKFKDIQEANEVLKDPEKRQRYDQLGANWDQVNWNPGNDRGGVNWGDGYGGPNGGPFNRGANTREYHYEWNRNGDENAEAFDGFSDFFNQFFGHSSGARTSRTAAFHEDQDDFFQAARSQQSQPAHEEAELQITLEQAFQGGSLRVQLGGKQVNLKVPEKVYDGQKIRLKGMGSSKSVTGETSDLHIIFRFKQHSSYEILNHDLITTLQIAPWHAALGTTATIRTLTGNRMNVKVPEGTSTGQKLRIPKNGLYDQNGGRGDLFFKVEIIMPPGISSKEKELYRQLEKLKTVEPQIK